MFTLCSNAEERNNDDLEDKMFGYVHSTAPSPSKERGKGGEVKKNHKKG